MKYENNFNSRERKRPIPQLRAQTTSEEFNSVEEMLRFDAKQIVVPPEIAQRLDRSVQKKLCRPWWRRWLG